MEASNEPCTSQPHAQVFTLDALGMIPQSKSAAPRIKVDKTYELTKEEGVKWFVDSYDSNANYKADLHLYLSRGDMAYGDMGTIVGVKDDVDSTAIPCFACSVLPEGETTKATKFCLSLDAFYPFDMIGSKEGKENSIVKLGLKINNFSNQEESGVESIEDLVKGVRQAKRALGLHKKALPEKRITTTQAKKAIERKGREIVKSMLAESRRAGASPLQHQVVDNQTKKRKVTKVSTSKAVAKDSIKKQKMRMTSGDRGDELSEDELMEVDAAEHTEAQNENKGIEDRIEGNKAMASLEIKKVYYPFGVNTSFSIDVMKCFPAPSNYVYRKLNPDWVKILTHDFVEDTKQEEILAILMPIDPNSKTPLSKLAKEDIHQVDYWIISGQHSISASKRLQQSKSTKVTPLLRRQFRFRRSKIILNCPPKITREISKDANISVAKSMQKEPFLDQLMQARSQWIANGRPNKPPPGINLSKKGGDFDSWKVLLFFSFNRV